MRLVHLFDDPEVKEVIERAEQNAVDRLSKLTARQRQILGLMLDGHPNKNIAADLGISSRSVESHKAEIMKRTGTCSLAALVRLVMTAS